MLLSISSSNASDLSRSRQAPSTTSFVGGPPFITNGPRFFGVQRLSCFTRRARNSFVLVPGSSYWARIFSIDKSCRTAIRCSCPRPSHEIFLGIGLLYHWAIVVG